MPPERLILLCGEFNKNLKQIEKALKIKILQNGTEFDLSGKEDDVQIGVSALFDLKQKLDSNAVITPDLVHLSLHSAKFNGEEVSSKKTPQIKTPRVVVSGRGKKQNDYLSNIKNSDLTFGIGPSGTGKTFLAVASAVKMYSENRIKKIVLTRPAVEAGERLGYLPGDLSQKIDPYLVPLFDSLEYFFGNETLQYLIEKRNIEIVPLAYMRGRTLNDACIILDEAQNATISQIKMFLTRLGENSKMIITGDETQIDLNNKTFSGLKKTRKTLSSIEEVSVLEFENTDIVRNKIVSKILEIFPDK